MTALARRVVDSDDAVDGDDMQLGCMVRAFPYSHVLAYGCEHCSRARMQ
jgi:hypothetical protein